MGSDDFQAHFARLLSSICPPDRLRARADDPTLHSMWTAIEDSGFLDILLPESAGGAALPLGEAFAILKTVGWHAPPLPVAETMVARRLICAAGCDVPKGSITLASRHADIMRGIPCGMVADFILADTGKAIVLIDGKTLRRSATVPGSLAADIGWPDQMSAAIEIAPPDGGLRPLAAIVRATAIAGLAGHLLEMTVEYANSREQFGKPIGKQQAVQQQLAVMAEKVMMSRIAAQLGCAAGHAELPAMAAVAKHVTSAAAVDIAAIAHAVHGAIGISEECDLQLYTRRLLELRIADGSEGLWATDLGNRRLASSASSLDFIRALASPAACTRAEPAKEAT